VETDDKTRQKSKDILAETYKEAKGLHQVELP
jgi:hypothetical protein